MPDVFLELVLSKIRVTGNGLPITWSGRSISDSFFTFDKSQFYIGIPRLFLYVQNFVSCPLIRLIVNDIFVTVNGSLRVWNFQMTFKFIYVIIHSIYYCFSGRDFVAYTEINSTMPICWLISF